MKTYVNKDYVVYKCLADSIQDWHIVHDFKRVLFKKFAGISDYDLYVNFGAMPDSEVLTHYLSYNTGMAIVKREPDHYIIPKYRPDIIDFFEKNMPGKFFEFKTTRLKGLNSYLQHRDYFNNDFEKQMGFYKKTRNIFFEEDYKKEEMYMKTLDGYYEHVCKQRKEKIDKIITNV